MEILTLMLTGLNILVCVYVIDRTVKLINQKEPSLTAVFFLLGNMSLLCSTVYWLVYEALRPEIRMPFAVNEIGEEAGFLLYASAVSIAFRDRFVKAGREMVFTILFMAASVALWISWSGEWLEDIICGFALGYLACEIVRALKSSEALSGKEWRGLGILAGTLVLLQAAIFWVPEPWKKPLDITCYALMFAILVFLLFRYFFFCRRKTAEGQCFSLAFACFFWDISVMYMSEGMFYYIAWLSNTLIRLMQLKAVREEVGKS